MIRRQVKAGFVDLEVQGARQQLGPLLQVGRIGRGNLAHGVDVRIQPRAGEIGGVEILRGANKISRPGADRRPHGRKAAARLWRPEQQHLLRALWNRQRDAVPARPGTPGFHLGKPAGRWRIERSPQEHRNHQIVDNLIVRHIWP